LNFVNDSFEKSKDMIHEYYHHYKIVNIKHTEKQIKGLEFVFIELPKFKPQNRAEKKLHDLWLRFLTEINEETTEIPKGLEQHKHIREAIGYMERSAYSKEELDAYQQWKIDAMTATAMLENAHEEGKTIGREEGEAIGIEKGEAIGLEKGRAEEREKAKMETVIKAHKAGCSIELISSITGLTPQQITEILKQNNLM